MPTLGNIRIIIDNIGELVLCVLNLIGHSHMLLFFKFHHEALMQMR